MNYFGIYSDQSENFLMPVNPKVGDEITIKIRIPKKYGKVKGRLNFLVQKHHNKYKHTVMHLEKEDEYFKYFSTKFKLTERIIRYHFEIHFENDNRTIKYDSRGIVEHRHVEDFIIIPNFEVPEWSIGAIYYQIFPDRFNNGDKTNDPVDGEYIYDGEKIRKKEWNEYPHPTKGHTEFYGGDIQGIIDKLDYLKELGIEVIYLNPIFVSPSPHKYDTQDYEHIDPHLGVIVEDTEDLTEKYKIRTTSKKNLEASDKLFAKLVEEAHKRNIKIILDGVFNHCGSYHKWVNEYKIYGEDVGVANNKEVPESEYFYWDKNNEYEGWWGYKSLPKLNYDKTLLLWKYISQIGEKWVSYPYNADGWRLDVARDLGKTKQVNKNFWKYFRTIVKRKNPESIIFAEDYESPKEWIENLSWDGIMNYIGAMDPISYFLTGMEKHNDDYKPELLGNSEWFIEQLRWAWSQMPMNSKYLSMNQLSNHDHSRWATRTTKKVGRSYSLGPEEAEKGIDWDIFKIGIIMLFTLPGSPGIYYGDEIGLPGWTDPDNRRTFPWDKLKEKESQEKLNFFKEVIDFYKKHPVLRNGSIEFLKWEKDFVSYGIWNNDEKIVVIVNISDKDKDFEIPVWLCEVKEKKMKKGISIKNNEIDEINVENGSIKGTINKKSFIIFLGK
ncbi:glycosidase [Marinitoga piezophila KA3]|uniref:Glycosidase n=1 Tax=Marinitoga piezophila (strain DSM 14283 / JCM 11233 / KA3) TaxID=443254 RepID=H2J5U6_MARPK|nr:MULTISPECIES: glycoside hydrolase family 13 protein [Marinitoga]AEX86165.1 glycosidase [Marinitoga piezophila KA3]APT76580.1 alpha-amylase [Marinitoga sp. 1137]